MPTRREHRLRLDYSSDLAHSVGPRKIVKPTFHLPRVQDAAHREVHRDFRKWIKRLFRSSIEYFGESAVIYKLILDGPPSAAYLNTASIWRC
jgi:hypothetical protein